jgi:hypothetical protein
MAKDAGGHGSEAKMAPEAPEAPEAKMAAMKAEAKMAPEAPEAPMDSRVRGVLAQGHPKSAPVPVHSGTAGPRYNRAAVNDAIASSNRAGRRIGGKEASAIHRVLKGRG